MQTFLDALPMTREKMVVPSFFFSSRRRHTISDRDWSSDVCSSDLPTHSVAVWGADAAALVAGHVHAKTPCGVGSPYARLLDRDGKILFLGCDVKVMTFFHTVEELLEPRMPFSPFTQQEYLLESVDADGRAWTTRTRLSDPALVRRRNLTKLR